jgi:putative hydrolase
MRMHPALKEFAFFEGTTVPPVDYHMHTIWTDGANSVQDMHAAAIGAGMTHILFSEHARKTSGDWFGSFAAEVRGLPAGGCRAMVGVESKIESFEGTLDLTDDIRHHCDLVMGSVHRFPNETSIDKANPPSLSSAEVADTEFRLSRAAVRAGHIDILGHPFGMSYRRFKIEPPEEMIEQLASDCARYGVAFEVNGRYHRDPWRFIAICRKHGAPISLGSNAHRREEVGAITRLLKDTVRA